jgi:hypothetical protein
MGKVQSYWLLKQVVYEGRATNLARVPNLGEVRYFMKEVQPFRDKHDKLKIKERTLFFTGELIFPAIRVAVRSWNIFVVLQNILLSWF